MNEKQIIDFFKHRKKNLFDKEPPEGHAERFQAKLIKNKRKIYPLVYKWAAIIAILISLPITGLFYPKNTLTDEESKLKETEFFFSNTINYELKKINDLRNSSNKKLIESAEDQLKVLEKEYQKIWEKYQLNYKNEIISKAIIENLEQRIEILNNLNEQLNILKINTDENNKNI